MDNPILSDPYRFYTEFYIPVNKKLRMAGFYDNTLLFVDSEQLRQFAVNDVGVVRYFGAVTTVNYEHMRITSEKNGKVSFSFFNKKGFEITEEQFTAKFYDNF